LTHFFGGRYSMPKVQVGIITTAIEGISK